MKGRSGGLRLFRFLLVIEHVGPAGAAKQEEHVSRILREATTRILCSLDCVAEREGFEPSVQVLARTTV
jgi:BMFP domain-containing protein YqiC